MFSMLNGQNSGKRSYSKSVLDARQQVRTVHFHTISPAEMKVLLQIHELTNELNVISPLNAHSLDEKLSQFVVVNGEMMSS